MWTNHERIVQFKGNDEDEKTKGTKNCVIKIKLEFENYENCLEATQIKNDINYLEKNKIFVGSLRELKKYMIN